MTDKKYQGRDVLDKLGIRAGQVVAFARSIEALEGELARRIIERTGRQEVAEDELADNVLAGVDGQTDVVALLRQWRARIRRDGGIWLLTAKRGLPGYVDQRELIYAGQQAGVVDNKICSVSATTSAMRFVIRKAER